jgi:hypothetical protein
VVVTSAFSVPSSVGIVSDTLSLSHTHTHIHTTHAYPRHCGATSAGTCCFFLQPAATQYTHKRARTHTHTRTTQHTREAEKKKRAKILFFSL